MIRNVTSLRWVFCALAIVTVFESLFLIPTAKAQQETSPKPATKTVEPAQVCNTASDFALPVVDDDPNDNLTWGVPFNYFGHYFSAQGGFHPGEDWNLVGGTSGGVDLGEPVYAIADGSIEKISSLGSLGTLVAIKHTGNFTIPGKSGEENGQTYSYDTETVTSIYSVYLHINNLPAGIVEGACVTKGVTVVGHIMNPGGGPHLHFEIRHPDVENSNNWSLVGPSSNWAVDADGNPTGYYLNIQQMVNAGMRDPRDFIAANAGYVGYAEVIDCNSIRGWAADRRRLGTPIEAKVYDGDTLVATVLADQARPDVGSFLGDGGFHGFNIPTPASLQSGAHTVSVKFESSSSNLGNSPQSLTCGPAPPNYAGFVDFADCNVIRGWAADRNRPNTPIDVRIYDGAALVTTVTASQFRSDVGSFLGDNGLHGFNIPTPASLQSGAHTLSVKFETSGTNLGSSPQALTCGPVQPNYAGFVDFADCNVIRGWAADRNRLNLSISVSIYDGATLLTSISANQSRPDVGSFLGDNGLHGFNIPTPASLKDGNPHTVRVKFESSATELNSSPITLSCGTPPPNYIGYIDSADCNVIRGWAADRNRPSTPIEVRIYDGTTLVTTVTANQLRSDVGSFLGDNGLHGFNIPTPASLLTGTHTMRARFEASGTDLTNSPQTIGNCGVTPSVGSISPNPVPTFNANQNVQVNGSNFQAGLMVDVFNSGGAKIATLSGSQIQGVSANSFTMVINLGSSASSFGIEVINPDSRRSSRFTFSTIAPNPSISSISPNPVPVFNGNQNVQVNGSNFQFNLTVDVFNSSGTKIGTLSGSQILNVTPNSFTMVVNLGGAPSTFGIEVINANGGRSSRFSFSTR